MKLYNKRLHFVNKGFFINSEILRLEIKWVKMQKINEKGVFTLKELMNYGLHNFKQDLLTEWKNVLYFDNTIQIDPLGAESKKETLLKYSNPHYWTDLLSNGQTKNFRYHKNQLYKITQESSKNIQFLTSEIMSKKIDYLNTNTIQIDPYTIQSKRIVEELKYEINNPAKIDNETNRLKPTVCKVTGLSLMGQRPSSHFLSHTGLKLLFENNQKEFNRVLQKHLPKKYKNSDLETKIIQTAKSIRTKDCVNHIKQNRLYQEYQPQLFG